MRALSVPCARCGAPLSDADRFCRYCGDGKPQAAPAADDEITTALRGGNKIEAIRLFREKYKTGLRQAKEAVEDLAKRLGL